MSGALAQWRKRAIDFTMAGVMLAGGFVGTGVGVWLFALMRRAGPDGPGRLARPMCVLLGTVGGIMLNESLRDAAGRSAAASPPAGDRVNHVWIHGLPFKMRFRQSRLYISVIPPIADRLRGGRASAPSWASAAASSSCRR